MNKGALLNMAALGSPLENFNKAKSAFPHWAEARRRYGE